MLKKSLIFIALIVFGFFFYNSLPEERLDENAEIDKILVLKSERVLKVFEGEKLLKTYTISLGASPEGHKQFEGDSKTPEGIYIINDKNPNSGYHLNLGVSYPNQQDKAFALKEGKNPGGDIKIHGIRNGIGFINKFHRFFDWTAGCIALTNDEVKELYDHVKIGTEIEIKA